MLRSLFLAAALLLLSACGISGHYVSTGPCKGFHTDQQACQRAAENSLAIGRVKIGQSFSEVRQIMGRDPERREATADTETWAYLTDYMASQLTVINFESGSVTEIRQIPYSQ